MELAGSYVVFKFLKSKEAKGVANILMEVIRFGHGIPKRLRSDDAKEFVGQVVGRIEDKLGIQHISTARTAIIRRAMRA